MFESDIHSEVLAEENRLVLLHNTFTRSWNVNDDINCNFTLGGDGTAGYKHKASTLEILREKALNRPPRDEATCLKMSQSGKAAWDRDSIRHDNARQRRKKKISQFALDGTFIKTFSFIDEAAQSLGCSGSRISACAKGRRTRCGGFLWRYADE